MPTSSSAQELRQRITDAVIEELRVHGQPPASVYSFCLKLGITERDFFHEFASFDAVESGFWQQLIERVASAVQSGVEWESFSARQRLLTFYFAYCEESLDVRSLLLSRVAKLSPLERPAFLKGLERRFKEFAEGVVAHGISTGEIAPRGRLSTFYPETLYVHFRSVIDFHLKDESYRFERTDAFIEKSVTVAFDLLRTQVFDSAFDLARFLFSRASGGACGQGRAA
jgi:AcrR family transcriptional regulator